MNQPVFLHGSYPWRPDNGDGTYTNPVLFADYSDPDVIRVGSDFYLTASSFNQSPALPILHSQDLVNWEILTYAIAQPPGSRYEQVQPGCGVWAPSIRFHDNQFWIFFPMPDEGLFVTTAAKAEGPWCEPWLLQAGKGLIDPCPLWDDDGRAYLIFAYAESRCGLKHKLHIRPMSSDGKTLLGPGKIVFDGTVSHPTVEGPKLYKIGEYYYVSAPAGGVAYGWQLVMRSKQIYGPYSEPRVVLQQSGSCVNGPHQGAFVDDVGGNWWFLHFQEYQPYGRICHLQPVRWEDGWPLVGACTEATYPSGIPVLQHQKPQGGGTSCIPQTSDAFEASQLGLQWAFQAKPDPSWYSLEANPHRLRLHAVHCGKPNLAAASHVLVQKTPCSAFLVKTEVQLYAQSSDIETGLAVIGFSTASLLLRYHAGGYQVGLRLGNDLVLATDVPASSVTMVLGFSTGGLCRFGYMQDGTVVWFGPSFRASEGRWIGTRIGIFCSCHGPVPCEGFADFKYFRFETLPSVE